MDKPLSRRNYNIAIGITLLWGFFINYLMVRYCTSIFLNWNPIMIYIGYLVLVFVGVYLSASSRVPLVSFIGYNMVVLPLGVIICISLPAHQAPAVLHAILITLTATVVMIILAAIFPQMFLGLGRILFASLIGVMIGGIVLRLLHLGNPTALDWFVSILFCGYIGYDWAKAQSKPYTLDNAIDSVVDLYMDIVLLFLRLVALSSDSDND